MLQELRVDNYVLIKSLRFKPESGFNIITGETGAGKSILIGALGLILGERADSKAVTGNESKCIVEGVFDIRNLNLQSKFESYDLDYSDESILRREILVSGKSRAFINDTPVSLQVLRDIGSDLVDIHSQHQSLQLGDTHFLFNWLDIVSGCKPQYESYLTLFNDLKRKEKQLEKLEAVVASELAEKDYQQYLFTELEEANLDALNLEDIDNEFDVLQNAEEIGEVVGMALEGLRDGEDAALDRLNVILKSLEKLGGGDDLKALCERLSGVRFELEEVMSDLSRFAETAQPNPARLEELNEIQAKLQHLQTKHRVSSIVELVEVRNDLESKLTSSQNREDQKNSLVSEITSLKKVCMTQGDKLHNGRAKAIKELESELNSDLANLGLIHAQIQLHLEATEELSQYGRSEFELLFASNKGAKGQPAHKVASGGELSRLMLILKSYLAKNQHLPSIIFDEIDTGVSGEVALKMADVMTDLAGVMQVISITHLPQIASKGTAHYYVYKQPEGDTTATYIKQLNKTDRVIELAKMLSGDKPTDGALANARELLN